MHPVYFVGAGPGDPKLITIRGKELLTSCDLLLYAGSLVSLELVAEAPLAADVRDTSKMTLEQTHALLSACAKSGGLAVRLHTGDPSLYGAIREQIALLEAEGIGWEIVPGVTAAFAVAARAGVSLTVPERAQSLILTRISGRTKVPETESLRGLAAHRTSMAIYLSTTEAGPMADELMAGGLPPETPVAVGHRVGWPGEVVFRTTLAEVAGKMRAEGHGRQTVFLVLPGELPSGLSEEGSETRSKLYDPGFTHGFRQGEGLGQDEKDEK